MTNERSSTARQQEVFAFLREPAHWQGLAGHVERVEVIETHGAIVFMAGDVVLKVKRAVKLAYLDFSSLARRRAVCEREIALNRPAAPGIYLGVVAITRADDGTLTIGGSGTPEEWAVHMARFDQQNLLQAVAERGAVTDELARDLAGMVVTHHAMAPVASGVDMSARIATIVRSIVAGVDGLAANGADFGAAALAAIEAHHDLVHRRATSGLVRRCHGDLHLANVVLWQGRPTPFDAIEFDEDLATIDVLYDLAFLLMDLERHGGRAAANAVLGRYLWRTGRAIDLEGLALLPLFLALRAGVRAMVRADRARLVEAAAPGSHRTGVMQGMALARSYLAPPSPHLVAVGGLSGTGKTTLARRLAPEFGASPGALHLRTDLERKALAGVAETERLPDSAYTAETSRQVYDAVSRKAVGALAAGHSVIVDAVFARSTERQEIAQLAARLGVPFTGIWLDAAPDVMKSRVSARRDDASDATVGVVEQQLTLERGHVTWAVVAAGNGPDQTYEAARRVVGPMSDRDDPTSEP